MGDLLRAVDYSLKGKTYSPTVAEKMVINDNPTYINNDWNKGVFDELKGNIRGHNGRRQSRKCGYCRVMINPDGYANPIEHIVPRIKKPQWMFVQHNLVVSCSGCNSNKASENTLRSSHINYGDSARYCPSDSQEFHIFNPHFDRWSDHFEFEDSFFLVPKKNSKGPYTYNLCKMWRYQIIIDHRDQLRIRDHKSFRSLTNRLKKEKNSIKLEHLQKAKEYVIDMIENS